MMSIFDLTNKNTQKGIVKLWKKMEKDDKDYFIDQVALALSVWGTDDKGKKLVAKVLTTLVTDGSGNLADFGLYIEEYLEDNSKEKRKGKMERASGIISRYRLKTALSSIPHKEVEL